MDDKRGFLEAQVEDAIKKYTEAVDLFRTAAAAMGNARSDIATWQKALETYTRDLDNPYHPVSIPHPTLVANPPYVKFEVGEGISNPDKVSNNSDKQSPPVIPNRLDLGQKTKAGAMRAILRKYKGNITFDDILNLIPDNLSFKITRDDLHRMMPRFLERNEVLRVGRGLYRYNPAFRTSTNGASLFEEEQA